MLTNLDARAAQEVTPPGIAATRGRKPRPALRPDSAPPKSGQRLRRALDLAATLLLAVVGLPVIALAALAVRMSSRGPAFYTQIRIGRGGRPFTIYKIRTMVDNCESLTGPRWTIPGDPRITPIGWFLRCTHIDELPQLLNILAGDMSLVGPRPERPEFVEELDKVIPGYASRHAVLPGITGLAQVHLPPDTDVESVQRKLVYDLYYVRHASAWLDLRILLSTALHVALVPLDLLVKLRLVPAPRTVEAEVRPEAAPAPRLRKQAA